MSSQAPRFPLIRLPIDTGPRAGELRNLFSTKFRRKRIQEGRGERLYESMGGILRAQAGP